MHPRRFAIVTVISALLWGVGCHKTQSASSSSSNGQSAATQVQDNLPSNAQNATEPAQGTTTNAGNPATATTAQNGPAPQEAAPAKLIIPSGTPITIRLQQRLSSASAVPGERFEAVIDEPVMVGNQVVLPVGAPVDGHVTLVHRSGRLHHPGELALTLDRVTVDQQIVLLSTARFRLAAVRTRNVTGDGSAGGLVAAR